MSSDVFERNVEKLVRAAALPDADAAAARARFLREATPSPASRSRGIAAIAAALLIGVLLYSAVRTDTRPPGVAPIPRTPTREAGPDPQPIQASGGNDLLKLTVKVGKDKAPASTLIHLEGRSPLPDGVVYFVILRRLEESFSGHQLVAGREDLVSNSFSSTEGAIRIQLSWRQGLKLGRFQVLVTAPDHLQDLNVLPQLKVKEAERVWTFEFAGWNDDFLGQIDAQLGETSGFIHEVRELIRRIEAAAATAESFEAGRKELTSELQKISRRLWTFKAAGLYPAGSTEAHAVVTNLLAAMPNFAWKEGRFAGAPDYYQKAKGEKAVPFTFDGLRAALDEAAVVAGREFDLWILRDLARGGPRPALTEAVKKHEQRPGVAEFAPRLLGPADPALEAEIRAVAK